MSELTPQMQNELLRVWRRLAPDQRGILMWAVRILTEEPNGEVAEKIRVAATAPPDETDRALDELLALYNSR
jgi:hypothetical protein